MRVDRVASHAGTASGYRRQDRKLRRTRQTQRRKEFQPQMNTDEHRCFTAETRRHSAATPQTKLSPNGNRRDAINAEVCIGQFFSASIASLRLKAFSENLCRARR